jgi:hypothetical protein
MAGKWGKPGVRLTEQEIAQHGRTATARRNRRTSKDAENLRIAYQLWRAGEVKPYMITHFLDLKRLDGPEVDLACGAREPDVDLWEAGKLYPTWQQLRLLARICDVSQRFLCTPRDLLTIEQTSMRFHANYGPTPPRVWAFQIEAVQAVVGNAPFEMPEEQP